jgi:hypothetical protein
MGIPVNDALFESSFGHDTASSVHVAGNTKQYDLTLRFHDHIEKLYQSVF